MVQRFESANRLCRGKNVTHKDQSRTSHVRSSFVPMWNCLSALGDDSADSCQEDLRHLVAALAALRDARSSRDPDEAKWFIRPLLRAVPETRGFEGLTQVAPETRLKLFDELVTTFKETDAHDSPRRNALALVVGYLATVAAGGAASLALVESDAAKWPELTGWAYLVGGIGERITWTSGFDGLGRLVARELQRRLRIDEPPTCDFALDEALVLSDAHLKEPLVHLKIKQARVLTVALYPGVNVAIPLGDTSTREATQIDAGPRQPMLEDARTAAGRADFLETLAVALWPFLRPFVTEATAQGPTTENRNRKSSQRNRVRGKGAANDRH